MTGQTILVVDDEYSHRMMIKAVLSAEGFTIEQASSGEEALEIIESHSFDLVLMDVKMGRVDGFQAMQQMLHLKPGMQIILMTAYGTINSAVEAIKSGAKDYLTKPIDIEALKTLVQKSVEKNKFNRDFSGSPTDVSHTVFKEIIGISEPMQLIFDLVSRVAPTEASVLILGESGTGKELIADAIHRLSPRRDHPYITINCASLPETLLESELFGHEKGAFTGAVKKRAGRFQSANRGTIFLDEIADMPFSLQAKLLRVLQEQEIQPLGSSKISKVDIRVVAATNKVLEDAINDKRFREDLFYRLNVVSIKLPPLRERKSDIPLLADFFLSKYAQKNSRHLTGYSSEAMDALTGYHWPGNIRELENTVERAVILSRSETIMFEDLPPSIIFIDGIPAKTEEVITQEKSLKEMEKLMILRTLKETDGNRTHSAEILGISRRTLQLKLKEYGVNP
ncbi:MAG: sigma-54-dependent Fis family transcriptional regulator [Desulfamplus sp.]|nr:sigma-54-dependent Fis family transcriptional regulator [Desulfamplus sp.]